MTPKEKAKELVSKFNFEHTGQTYILHQTVDESKRCALIAVDEIFELHKKITVSHLVSTYKSIQDFNENFTNVQNELDSYVIQNYGYWQEVKQEINKL